jgi:catechol 2,3-dioxygenase-like lactoylglutathione lyase family enzyme
MIRILLAFLILASPILPAQQAATSAPSPNLAGIAHVALRVHDLAASIAFYEKLGFVKAFDLSRDGKVYEAFIKINDHQFIELYPTDAKNTQVGFLHVCFEGNDLQAVHDYYVAQGLTPNAVRTAGAGNLLFTMPGPITPTGPQNMEYTQYMTGSLHSKDFGQHLGPNRIATKLSSVEIAVNDPEAASKFYSEKIASKPVGVSSETFTAHLIPGTINDTIDIVPAARIGLKASIGLAAPDVESALVALKKRGIPVDRGEITDPDGNQIQFSKESSSRIK